jgi:hypothetical protein
MARPFHGILIDLNLEAIVFHATNHFLRTIINFERWNLSEVSVILDRSDPSTKYKFARIFLFYTPKPLKIDWAVSRMKLVSEKTDTVHSFYAFSDSRKHKKKYFFYLFFSRGEIELFDTAVTVWPIVPAPDDRWWWLWSNRWNKDCQGKPKYSKKTCTSATLSTTNPTLPDQGSNPGRRGKEDLVPSLLEW